ncbi:MAG: hypothetical protein ACOY3K_06150 [Candidatus Omnitrophota bacterium]
MNLASLPPITRSFAIRAGILGGVALLLCVFWIFPHLMKVRELRKEVDGLYLENQKIQESVLLEKNSTQKLEEIERELRQYEASVPTPAKLSAIINQVGSQAQAYKLELVSINQTQNIPYMKVYPKSIQAKGDALFLTVLSLEVEGSFSKLGQYVASLEKIPYLIVQRMHLQRKGEETAKAFNLRASLELGILMRFPKEEMNSV